MMMRFVTGSGPDGRDILLSEAEITPLAGMPGSRNETRLLWAAGDRVRLPHDGIDPVAGQGMSMPGPGELRFVFITFPPGAETPVHATPTTDYVSVVDGELWLVMEDGSERRIAAGDGVIQNGTRHAWANRSDAPCTISAVMVGAAAG